MITANSILTEIYVSDEVKKCVSRLEPEHLQQDILQHTFMELFEKPSDFIIDLYQRGKLKAYIVKILYNTATYSRSTFAKQQGKETPTDFNHDFNEEVFENPGMVRAEKKQLQEYCNRSHYNLLEANEDYKRQMEYESDVKCALAEIHWYKQELLNLYVELGTYKAVSDKTGIPLTSVFKTITELRKEIKQKL